MAAATVGRSGTSKTFLQAQMVRFLLSPSWETLNLEKAVSDRARSSYRPSMWSIVGALDLAQAVSKSVFSDPGEYAIDCRGADLSAELYAFLRSGGSIDYAVSPAF